MSHLFRETDIADAQNKLSRWIASARAAIDATRKSHPGIRTETGMDADDVAVQDIANIFFRAMRRMPDPAEQSGIVKAAANHRQLVKYFRDLLEAIVKEEDLSFTLAPGIAMADPAPPTQEPRKR